MLTTGSFLALVFFSFALQELGQQLLSNQQTGLAKFLAPVTPPLAQSTAFIDQAITRFDRSSVSVTEMLRQLTL
jgi:hypothetical protein